MAKKAWNLEAAVYSALRRAHRNSPEYRDALNAVKGEFYIYSKKGKKLRRVHFSCRICNGTKSRKEVFVDHIHPVIDPRVGKAGFASYINRLFCGVGGLQILCRKCHQLKTQAENAIRRRTKKEKANG